MVVIPINFGDSCISLTKKSRDVSHAFHWAQWQGSKLSLCSPFMKSLRNHIGCLGDEYHDEIK